MNKMDTIQVTIKSTEIGNDIAFVIPGATRVLKLKLEGFGFWYNKASKTFQSPLCKNQVLRVQALKGEGYPLMWDTPVIEAFAKCF
jgi:hypothetical protein